MLQEPAVEPTEGCKDPVYYYSELAKRVGLGVTYPLEPNYIGKFEEYPFQLFTGRQRFFMQSSFTDDPINIAHAEHEVVAVEALRVVGRRQHEHHDEERHEKAACGCELHKPRRVGQRGPAARLRRVATRCAASRK